MSTLVDIPAADTMLNQFFGPQSLNPGGLTRGSRIQRRRRRYSVILFVSPIPHKTTRRDIFSALASSPVEVDGTLSVSVHEFQDQPDRRSLITGSTRKTRDMYRTQNHVSTGAPRSLKKRDKDRHVQLQSQPQTAAPVSNCMRSTADKVRLLQCWEMSSLCRFSDSITGSTVETPRRDIRFLPLGNRD